MSSRAYVEVDCKQVQIVKEGDEIAIRFKASIAYSFAETHEEIKLVNR